MYGWWSEDYILQNLESPIYIYTTEFDTNCMVVAMTNSIHNPPNRTNIWICVGKIINHVNTINIYNLIEKNSNDDNDLIRPNKKQKFSEDSINLKKSKNYGWYSQEFVDKSNSSVFDKNNKQTLVPKIHKYKTPDNSTVIVTHVTSNLENKPQFTDIVYVGEVTEYLETISFN